jgi:DNA polymerase III delta subunit
MPRVSPQELLSCLEKGKVIPAILLLGDEPYLRDACRAQLIEKFVPEPGRFHVIRPLEGRRKPRYRKRRACRCCRRSR